MANEITATLRLGLLNGRLKQSFDPGQIKVDQTTAIVYDAVHNIGTTEESITAFGDVATEGICVLYNLDGTNYVQWGRATTAYIGRLKPLHLPAILNLEPGVDLFLKANTAACNVRVIVFAA